MPKNAFGTSFATTPTATALVKEVTMTTEKIIALVREEINAAIRGAWEMGRDVNESDLVRARVRIEGRVERENQ